MADSSSKQVSEADDLDYHITFPSPLPPDSTDDIDEDELEEPAALVETIEPVVILLGWMGCQDKHLIKFSDFYGKKR